MLRDVVGHLRCPLCEAGLAMGERAISCPGGHSFDVARQGYVNLLPGDARPGTADTPEMVAAREGFLAAGQFSPLAGAVAAECGRMGADAGGPVVDLGAGTGYYLAHVLDRLPGRRGIALDLSKHAVARAARAHPRIGAVVCDSWRPLPVKTGAAATVLSVFSPRNAPETSRILRPGGALLVVTPTREHLAELVPALGLLSVDERKEERLEDQLSGRFDRESRSEVTIALSLAHVHVEQLVRMGPSARHLDLATTRARVAALPEPVKVTASVALSLYGRR